ncbi:MAG: alpha/beta hydrolase [Chitinophagaceae bacterium]|nr:alpha/beta hydrolase [Chitinophagaceae bacterium]
MRQYFLYILFLAVITGCQKENQENNNNAALAEQTILNTAYGTDAQQKMDVYLPAGRTTDTTKVIILIHGGAWSSGDKADFTPFVDTLKLRLPGYAIFNINYRLATATANLFPTQENDVKNAVDFIISKSSEYKISRKIALLGASAGGHLALLHGYKNLSPVKVKAIVDFFGPTDMVTMHSHPANPLLVSLLETLLAGSPATNPAMYQQSSPINFVSPESPPTIILQGGLDPLVPVSQSTSLDAKLQSKGVVSQYVFYPAEGHGWTGANLTHSFNAIQAFLNANVN